jgi:hypothetical protein
MWTPIVLLNPQTVRMREYRSAFASEGVVAPDPGISHHFSYVLSDGACRRKIETFSHSDSIRPGWWETWMTWKPGSQAIVSPYLGQHQRAIYDPAPAEIRARWDAWQVVCDQEGIAA